MRLGIAFRAFIKAFKNPEKGLEFLEDKNLEQPSKKADYSHLKLLASLQQTSRLIDFIKEDLSSFSDAQVGAVVRKIHQDCSAALEDLVTIRPFKEEAEGSKILVSKGYNPSEIKIVGKIKGEPPFTGTLMHRGWKAQKLSLPKAASETSAEIICPAEVEVN